MKMERPREKSESDASAESVNDTAQVEHSTLYDEKTQAIYRKAYLEELRRRACPGCVLGAAPAAVRYRYGRHGKPRVVAAEPLEFSASDTAGLAMFAFARGCELGLDVEKIRPMPDAARIANAYFTAEEAASLASTPGDENAFFRYWVCKEAYVKATGEGLTRPLSGFGLTFQRGESVALEHVSGDGDQTAGWTLQLLEPPAGYAAALAYCGGSRTVAAWPVLTARAE